VIYVFEPYHNCYFREIIFLILKGKETNMNKVPITLFFILLVLVMTGSAVSEETAKQGSMAVTTSYHCPLTYMPMGKDLQITFEALGVAVADTKQGIFHNSSARILGSGLVLKSAYTEIGSITWTMPNGDQVFATYEGKGVGAGKLKGSFTIIGGTEKYSGITGGGDEETFNVPKPAIKGSVQGYAKWTGTWKLSTAE
jgi:hypothetical protein